MTSQHTTWEGLSREQYFPREVERDTVELQGLQLLLPK